MLNTPICDGGMVTAPHHLAAQAGRDVLRDGGNAVEAAIAAASTLCAVYPHMTGLGGDGFWLIAEPGHAPVAIDACGATGQEVTPALYRAHGCTEIPWRGPLAANSVAGTVSGWEAALRHAAGWGAALPLPRLLEAAIHYAEAGAAVSATQHQLTVAKLAELEPQPGFAAHYLDGVRPPAVGARQRQPALAETFRRLGRRGLDDFYHGGLARDLASDLRAAGSPLTAEDLSRHRAKLVEPLSTDLRCGRLYNFPPPTQGLASLVILALFDRLGIEAAEGFAHIHGLVEATKQAFLIRDREIADPAWMREPAAAFLEPSRLDALAGRIDLRRALPWPSPPSAGDTVWLGAIDREGRAVSFIQSIYFEFGSGVVLPQTGIAWQNRGSSMRLESGAINALGPGRKPFHTLNPAMAALADGRFMTYGTMGGEGQPQTQAAVFSRHAMFGQPLQEAITAPRWLLGRTWGEGSVSLKLESRFDSGVVEALIDAGHDVELLEPFTSTMGHAGALVRRPDGMIEGAADPRSDGIAAGF
jgi:gamma-glutamyltranspeptidase/glutathione hydrolase